MPHVQDHADVQRHRGAVHDGSARFEFRTISLVRGERENALDLALEETFPASDPVSITITVAVRVWPQPRDVN